MHSLIRDRVAFVGGRGMKGWEIFYIIVLFVGMLIGWLLNVYLAVAFIWALIILLELRDVKKSKSHGKS